MKVTYLYHSGFTVEDERAMYVFDYYKGKLPETEADKQMYVFVSHRHSDHFNPEIFEWEKEHPKIQYILSDDVEADPAPNRIFLPPDKKIKIGTLKIETLRSTDEGVAFLVAFRDKRIYHAGDLNWWHWEGEPEAYNTGMRRSYQAEINKLQKEKIDASFVPVDPRLGEQYCWGIDCFMKRTETSHVFPMHFWGNYEIFDRLMMEQCTQEYRDRIMKIEQEGQSFLLNGADN